MSGLEVAAVMAVASAAVSAVGAIQQGNAASAAAKNNAAIADRNKVIADQDRIMNVRAADIAAEDKRREDTRRMAAIRAAYGTNSVEFSGSPLDVLIDTSQEMATDQRRIEYQGKIKNREGALQMLYLDEEASLARANAKNSRTAGYLSAGASLLKGASSAGSMYYGGSAGINQTAS